MNNGIVKAAPSLPGLASAVEADALAAQFIAMVDRDLGRPRLERLPTPAERRVLQDRNAELAIQGRAMSYAMADRERGQRAIELLFAGFPSMRNADGRALVAVYLSDMIDLPAFAVERAVDDVKHGRVRDLDPDWPPTSPRVYAIARPYAEDVRERSARIGEVLRIEEIVPPMPTEAEQARVGKLLAGVASSILLRDQEEQNRVAARVKREHADYEQRAMLRWYAARGIEPVYSRPGVLMSPALYEKMVAIRKPDKRARR